MSHSYTFASRLLIPCIDVPLICEAHVEVPCVPYIDEPLTYVHDHLSCEPLDLKVMFPLLRSLKYMPLACLRLSLILYLFVIMICSLPPSPMLIWMLVMSLLHRHIMTYVNLVLWLILMYTRVCTNGPLKGNLPKEEGSKKKESKEEDGSTQSWESATFMSTT